MAEEKSLAEQYPEEYKEFTRLWEEETHKCILCSHPFSLHRPNDLTCRQCKRCLGFRPAPDREYILRRVKARLGIFEEEGSER